MADYSNSGEFQGTLGQGQGLWAVLEGNNILIRPEVVIAGTTSTATQGQSVDTWSGAPPAGAFAIPIWQMGGGATLSSLGSSITAHLDAPISVQATAQTTAKATASDPSYVEGTDSPLSQDLSGHIRTLTVASVTVPQPLAVNSMQSTGNSAFPWFVTTSSASSSIVAHLDAPVSVAFPATQNVLVLNSAGAFGAISVSNFPVSQNVIVTNSVGVSATQVGTWTINTIPVGSVGSVTVLQGTTPWQVLSVGSVGTVNTIPIGSMGTILVTQGTNPWTISNQTSVGTVLVTQGTTPWTVINQTSVGTVLVTQGGAPWSVINLTSVGTITTVPLGSVGVFAQQAGTWNIGTLTSITSSVGVSASQAGSWTVTTTPSGSVGVSATIVSPLDTGLKQVVVTQGSGGSSPWIDNPTVITSGDQTFAVGSRQPISQTSSGKVIISGADFPNTTIPTYGLVMAGSAGSGFNLSGKTQMITATPIPLQGSTSSTGMEMSLATRTRQYFGNKATYSVSAATSVGIGPLGNQQSVAYLFHNSTDAKRYQLNRVRVSATSASYGATGPTNAFGFLQVVLARISSEGAGAATGRVFTPLSHDPGDSASTALFRVGSNVAPIRVVPDIRTSLIQLTSPNEYDYDFVSVFEGKPLICVSGTSSGYEVRVSPQTTISPTTSVAVAFTWTEELATTQ